MRASAFEDLVRRREALVARSAALRGQFAAGAQGLQAPLAAADRVRDAAGWLRAHPYLLLGGAAAVVAVRPRRALAFSLKAWGAWRVWRRLMAALRD